MSKKTLLAPLGNPVDNGPSHTPAPEAEPTTPEGLLEKYHSQAIDFARKKARDYNFKKYGINEAEVESCAQNKCWHCAQHHDATRGEFKNFMQFSVRRALLSLLKKRITELGLIAEQIFDEIADFNDSKDPQEVKNETNFVFHLDDDSEEAQRLRERTIRTLKVVLNAKTAEDIRNGIPEKRGELLESDLLTEAEVHVLKECGAGKTAAEISEQEKSKKYGLDTHTKVSNAFIAAFKRLWKILQKLGYYWLQYPGVLRGESLQEADMEENDIDIRDPRLFKKTVMRALMQLYGMS